MQRVICLTWPPWWLQSYQVPGLHSSWHGEDCNQEHPKHSNSNPQEILFSTLHVPVKKQQFFHDLYPYNKSNFLSHYLPKINKQIKSIIIYDYQTFDNNLAIVLYISIIDKKVMD
jgi:hypothetical protein